MGTESAPGDTGLVRRAQHRVGADLADAFRAGNSPHRRVAITRLAVGTTVVTSGTGIGVTEFIKHSAPALHDAGVALNVAASSPEAIGLGGAFALATAFSALGAAGYGDAQRRGPTALAEHCSEGHTVFRALSLGAGGLGLATAGATAGVIAVASFKHGVPIAARDAFDAAGVLGGAAVAFALHSVFWGRRTHVAQRRAAGVNLSD